MNKTRWNALIIVVSALVLSPAVSFAQQESSTAATTLVAAPQQSNVPEQGRQAESAVQRGVKRFGIGIDAGFGLFPELIVVGAHGTFAPVFKSNIEFRPGVELGFGEVTTAIGINLDVLYQLSRRVRQSQWTPYFGAGPTFAFSHVGVEGQDETTGNRFNFSDSQYDPGLNFIAGVRHPNGAFVEIKGTAWGVSNVSVVVGYSF
jgi:hypothetical protein